MITYLGQKMTANEIAKIIFFERGDNASPYWDEDTAIEYDKMTDKEKGDVNSALERQRARVAEYLGIWKISEKYGLWQGD